MEVVHTVQVENLVARYGDKEVLSGVDLLVSPGEVQVILGGSGCGKSTLLKHIIGLYTPFSGTIRLLGTDLFSADEPEREALLKKIGMLFQAGALLNSLTVAENVALPIREALLLPEPLVEEIVALKLSLVGLSHAAELYPSQISGGMKKRAALARAMALDPLVLFCDEPGAGLDPITSSALDDLLIGLRDRFGMSLVVVTHELSSIERIADRVTMLDAGKVVASGTLKEVKKLDIPLVTAFFGRRSEHQAATPNVLEMLMGAT